MKKVIIILGFMALLLLVLSTIEDDITKLLKKDKLSEEEKAKLKQLRDKIDQKIGETEEPEAEILPPTPEPEKPTSETTEKKEDDIVIVKDVWQGKRQFEPVTEPEAEKEEDINDPNAPVPPDKQKFWRRCRRCGILIPKYPINEIYCPDCKETIRKEKEAKKEKEKMEKEKKKDEKQKASTQQTTKEIVNNNDIKQQSDAKEKE